MGREINQREQSKAIVSVLARGDSRFATLEAENAKLRKLNERAVDLLRKASNDFLPSNGKEVKWINDVHLFVQRYDVVTIEHPIGTDLDSPTHQEDPPHAAN